MPNPTNKQIEQYLAEKTSTTASANSGKLSMEMLEAFQKKIMKAPPKDPIQQIGPYEKAVLDKLLTEANQVTYVDKAAKGQALKLEYKKYMEAQKAYDYEIKWSHRAQAPAVEYDTILDMYAKPSDGQLKSKFEGYEIKYSNPAGGLGAPYEPGEIAKAFKVAQAKKLLKAAEDAMAKTLNEKVQMSEGVDPKQSIANELEHCKPPFSDILS